jgi:ABC-2 type transport system ATP-binding protein
VSAGPPAVTMEAVGKRYRKYEERAMLLRSLLPLLPARYHDFWALRGIDLTVAPGETVGILGRNGAGKTTMLRLLAGVTRPTEGRVGVVGRVAPLISVGVGFHKEMSGRENVHVNAMLLGLTRPEIEERFDDIVAFAELADFIDTPVKFYSSGMFMRLGFAVAVHTDPQVLLVDEVLAVGDSAFQLKCLQKMQRIQQSGTTILMVSHSMHAIRLLCPRTILIRRGGLEYDGETEGAITRHHELLAQDGPAATDGDDEARVLGGVTVLERKLLGPDGAAQYVVPGAPLRLSMRLRFDREVDSPLVTAAILNDLGAVAFGGQSPVSHHHRAYRAGDEAEVEIRFVARLGGGSYRLTTSVRTADGRDILDADPTGIAFYVEPRPWAYGPADLEAVFSVDGTDLVDDRSYRLEP